ESVHDGQPCVGVTTRGVHPNREVTTAVGQGGGHCLRSAVTGPDLVVDEYVIHACPLAGAGDQGVSPGARGITGPADDRAGGGGDGGAVLPHLDAGARGDGSSGEDGADSAGAAGDTDKIVLVGVILRDTGNSGTGGG